MTKKTMATILGIDWGSKRVGVSRANSQLRMAEPLVTLECNGECLDDIISLAEEESVSTVVVGLPRNLEGGETEQSKEIREFAQKLDESLQCSVVMQDETLSTNAGQELASLYPKADRDSLAATVILQDYLNANQDR